jgi:multiple sugar transport system substrate-binding protein
MKTKICKTAVLGMLLVAVTFGGVSCRRGGSIEAQQAYRPIELEYWTVFNSPDDFREVIADYQAIHPNVRINVKKFRYEEYEQQLLNALAEDRGPDIFSLHNTWLPAYRTKLFPLPSVTTLAYQSVTGSIKKEVITEFRSTRSVNEADLRLSFLEQVYKDVFLREATIVEDQIQQGDPKIYALPLAFDTMVMYFNRDLLDNAGLAQPARAWHEFQEHVQRLARFDSQGNILTAGTALGTSNNVPRSVDVLSVLMMQNGAEMINAEDGQVNFHRIPEALRGTRSTIPGEEALRFYTSFANQNNRNYTWNDDQVDGFEAFLQGKVAYFFGYAYHLEQIRGLAPRLNFGISNLPQIQGNPEVHLANYWVEAVSRKTQDVDAAWDFLQFATSATEAQKFVRASKKPTARRDLVDAQLEDTDLFVFASQLLRAKSWYTGQDAGAMEGIMKTLIDDTLAGRDDLDELLQLAAERVQQTLRL